MLHFAMRKTYFITMTPSAYYNSIAHELIHEHANSHVHNLSYYTSSYSIHEHYFLSIISDLPLVFVCAFQYRRNHELKIKFKKLRYKNSWFVQKIEENKSCDVTLLHLINFNDDLFNYWYMHYEARFNVRHSHIILSYFVEIYRVRYAMAPK